MAQKILVKTDKNGTKYWACPTCRKCGGAGGSDAWTYTGWTCYRCGGSGLDPKPEIYKEYTPEYQAKLDERRAKREAKKQAEHEAKLPQIRKEWLLDNNFNEDGQTYLFLGNTYEMKEDIKAAGGTFSSVIGWHIAAPVDGFQFLMVTINEVAYETYNGYQFSFEICPDLKQRCKAELDKLNGVETKDSQYIGEVKQRLTLEVTYTGSASWEQPSYLSWEPDVTMYLHKFVDADGNILVWKTGSGLGIEAGSKIKLVGTVKDHSEYKGTKQTVLTRCKIA
jgi:hypothetical protein